MIGKYWQLSSKERLIARRSVAKTELSGSTAIDAAALSWIAVGTSFSCVVTALILGIGLQQAFIGSERAIPFIVTGASGLIVSIRSALKWARFRRLVGSHLLTQVNSQGQPSR